MLEEFRFSWTYHIAASVRDLIYRDDPKNELIEINDYFVIDANFVDKAMKPSKRTLLHDFISDYFCTEIGYWHDKLNDSYTECLIKLLNSYKVAYEAADLYDNSEEECYHDYIFNLVDKYVANKVVNEVFTILFSDRQLLMRFNNIIAEMIQNQKKYEHPALLAVDGKVKRCSYWPSWLKKALLHRDKGCCSMCFRDLTGVINMNNSYAVDHIVPLNLGGVNDPTNLQLLCETCNTQKGGGATVTSSKYFMYW